MDRLINSRIFSDYQIIVVAPATEPFELNKAQVGDLMHSSRKVD